MSVCAASVRAAAILVLILPGLAWGQGGPEPTDEIYFLPYGALAWWKLALLVLCWCIWLRLTDWVNQDAYKFQTRTNLPAAVINPVMVGAFFVGLASVLFIPFFLAGFPLFLVGCFAPFFGYLFMRNSRMPEHLTAFTRSHLSRKVSGEQPLVKDANLDAEWPPIKLEASGSEQVAQTNLIKARQACDWVILRSLIYNAMSSRADTLVGRRTSQGGQWRKRIDGVWHVLAPMDPPMAEGSYLALKHLAAISPADRSARQTGHFTARMTEANRCEIAFVRDPKSETVQIKFIQPKKLALMVPDLGMFPDDIARLTATINSPGLAIISAPPGEGLSTTWFAVLMHADRVTKDWVALIDYNENETQVENIEPNVYDSRKGQRPIDILRSILLKQPEVFVVPAAVDGDSLGAFIEQVLEEHRALFTRTVANSAAEALLEVMQRAPDKAAFVQALTLVTSQRLARRLCDKCKQPMPATPDLIRKLGGDPGAPPVIYAAYKPPDPPPVDKKGNPIEIKPCSKCAGVGYLGRFALVELLQVDDALRQVLLRKPDAATITQLGLVKPGRSAMQLGLRHVLAGTTSLAEIQRVFKPAK